MGAGRSHPCEQMSVQGWGLLCGGGAVELGAEGRGGQRALPPGPRGAGSSDTGSRVSDVPWPPQVVCSRPCPPPGHQWGCSLRPHL